MARSSGQKLKLLLLRDYLLQNTDENHGVTVRQMIEHLDRCGVKAERKSLYSDLDALGEGGYGMDILSDNGRYSLASRDFELQEVKLLVDMVQSSNFITKRKTQALIKKLETLVSVHDAKLLERNVYVRNRVKAMNESVYINVDRISEAINEDARLRFQYFQYNRRKQEVLRHGGRVHEVSPFALIWVDQNYYLLAYDPAYGAMRHYRVDRMTQLSARPGPREGKALFEKTDMSTYTAKVFNMFTGEEKRVTLRFAERLADPVIDRFGEDVILIPEGDAHFTVTVDVVVSPTFYAWLSSFGRDAEILAPAEVRAGMAAGLRELLSLYEKEEQT